MSCVTREGLEDLGPHRFRHRYAFELDRRGFNDREASTRVGSNKAREDN